MFKDLEKFIRKRMRMSHVYQPVMLITLLKSGGVSHEREIARNLVMQDESQLEYYIKITNGMVGRVLRNHGIVERDPKARTYRLLGYSGLTHHEIHILIELCQQKLNEFLDKRGSRIFQHRRKSAGYVTGTVRYEILKRARFRCELCGIPADEKALEVDHILQRNHGGTDDPSNLQALCFSCNAMKRDRDDTDFRAIREAYDFRDSSCLFCSIDSARVVADNSLAFLIRDGYPVTPFHSLVIPKRHVATYFELGQAEINACNYLLHDAKRRIESIDGGVVGFNIGINNGEHAGQTIGHAHIHLIPRRAGDVEDPRGGVRHIVPGKGYY